jgi:hypothetical protein
MRIERQGSGSGGPDDPLIAALIQKLPKSLPVERRRAYWFKLLAMAFQMTYGAEPFNQD